MFDQLNNVILKYEECNPDASTFFQRYEEKEDDETTPFILVLVTEFMMRVHKLVSLSTKCYCLFHVVKV